MSHNVQELIDERNELRARLAEVEAERDALAADLHDSCQEARESNLAAHAHLVRAEAAEARLADVLAVPYCRDAGHTEALHIAAKCCDPYVSPCAAAAGDRAEAEPVYPFGTPCRFAGTGCGEEYCTCAETVGHFCPIECVTCGAAGDDLGFSGLCPTCRGIGRHLDGCTAPPSAGGAAGDRAEAATRCSCGKPAEHVNADDGSDEWACLVRAEAE